MRLVVQNKLYTKGDEIAIDGHSSVYKVKGEKDQSHYALRQIDLHGAAVEVAQHYKREGELLRNLENTAGIVQLVAMECTPSWLYIVTELGDTNLACILEKNDLGVDQVKHFARQLFEILRTLHSHGLVHDSLQPSSFICIGSTLKLANFGLGAGHTVDAYRAPEGTASSAGDVWSCGCILHELIYGRLPPGPLDKVEFDPKGRNFSIKWDLHELVWMSLTQSPKARITVEGALQSLALSTKTVLLGDIDRILRACVVKGARAGTQAKREDYRALAQNYYMQLS